MKHESTNEPVAQKIWEEGEYGPYITELKDIPVGTMLYMHPQDQKKDEALRLALEALKFSTSPAPSVEELQNDAITLIEQALENK